MFRQIALRRNHYLQRQLSFLDPELVNDRVTIEFAAAQQRHDGCKVPFEHKCPSSSYFDEHAPLAYGWFALPKLLREICGDDKEIQWRALYTLSEFLTNPLEAQNALRKHDIVRRIKNAFLRIRLHYSRDLGFREIAKLLQIFVLLSKFQNGAEQIASKKNVLHEFYTILYNNEKHKEATAKILQNLSEKPKILLYLLQETDSLQKLSEVFMQDRCKPYYPEALWMHLCHFLEYAPVCGIDMGFFELLHERIKGQQPRYHCLDMHAFGLLLRCREGQQRFDAIDGIKLLYDSLQHRKKHGDCEQLLFALTHALHSKSSLWRAREFIDLPHIVLQLWKQPQQNERLEKYCIQTLRELAQMPCIKAYMQLHILPDLHNMNGLNFFNECAKDELVNFLQAMIGSTTNQDDD